MASTLDLARVSSVFLSQTCQFLIRFLMLFLTSASVYYYFYEGGRTAILKSRRGSKGLSTFESLLNGCIAGRTVRLQGTPKVLTRYRRIRYCNCLQPVVGCSNPSNSQVQPQECRSDTRDIARSFEEAICTRICAPNHPKGGDRRSLGGTWRCFDTSDQPSPSSASSLHQP